MIVHCIVIWQVNRFGKRNVCLHTQLTKNEWLYIALSKTKIKIQLNNTANNSEWPNTALSKIKIQQNKANKKNMNDRMLHCRRLRPHTTTQPIKMNDCTLHCQRLRSNTTTQPIKINDRTLHWTEWFVVLGRKMPPHQHSHHWTSLQPL